MPFFLATRDEISLIHRRTTAFQLVYRIILPVSARVQKVVDQLRFLEIIRDSQFGAVAALMAWKTMVVVE